jgi:hypothetical protein
MGCCGSSPNNATSQHLSSGHRDAVVEIQPYRSHDDAVIIASYFNPSNSEYRRKAFLKFHESIKNCNYRLIEAGFNDQKFLLPEGPYVKHVRTSILLWHKESLLNIVIRSLPSHFKYVFWLDGDISFTNRNWIIESVEKLQSNFAILQPFEYVIHLDQNEIYPSSKSLAQKRICTDVINPREDRRV